MTSAGAPIIIGGSIFLLVTTFLQSVGLAVGIDAASSNVPCDKPLDAYLVMNGCCYFAIVIVLAVLVGVGKGPSKGENVAVNVAFALSSVLWLVTLILGFVWVYSSDTCEDESRVKEMWGWSMYDWSLFFIWLTVVGIPFSILACVGCFCWSWLSDV